MKTAFFVVISVILLILSTVSCTGGKDKYIALNKAEEAYATGLYSEAQSIADSIMFESSMDLGVNELCRLSLLFARLGDNNGYVDSNTAMAARALSAAFALDSDSTANYLSGIALEDRASMAIVTALTTAGCDSDSFIVEPY